MSKVASEAAQFRRKSSLDVEEEAADDGLILCHSPAMGLLIDVADLGNVVACGRVPPAGGGEVGCCIRRGTARETPMEVPGMTLLSEVEICGRSSTRCVQSKEGRGQNFQERRVADARPRRNYDPWVLLRLQSVRIL